jgi:hypothetical protein
MLSGKEWDVPCYLPAPSRVCIGLQPQEHLISIYLVLLIRPLPSGLLSSLQ